MSHPSCPRPLNNRRGGFSLIELLVAITVFAFLVIGVMSMSSVQVNANSFLQHHTKALQLAEAGMEEMNRADYDTQLAGYSGRVDSDLQNFLGYQREFTVQWGEDISTLSVRVFWQKGGRDSNSIILNSIRTR